ncbi:hypothetical protein GCM10009574_077410 [Streptomyces asiaticus]|uniref:Uncharacterized protein n=3 Tax=Streptomyces TaxID=1883 RepID=A0ABN1PJE4_9ACTN
MGAQTDGALMHTSDRATTPTREARVMAFLGSHDLVGIPAGEPNLTVRELLIAVHRVSVAHPALPCAPPPEQATLRCAPGPAEPSWRDRSAVPPGPATYNRYGRGGPRTRSAHSPIVN